MAETLKAKSLSHSYAACTGPLDPEGKFQPLLPTVRLQIQPSRDRRPRNIVAPSVHQRLAGRFGGKFEAEGGCAGPGGKVDAPELSPGPGWKIQEVSRLGAQGVTSKSKLLAREMPRVCGGGLRVDSG